MITRAKNRRGVLLLIVLSMLTLFLMLGTAYLVAATRARASATAFARLTFGGDETRIPAGRMLDTVLLRVVAGGATPPTGGPSGLRFESLLADKFGLETPTTGSATTVTVSDAVIEATLVLDSAARPSDLNGRVLSFIEPGRVVSSHRIIRARGLTDTNASTATPTVVLDRPYCRERLALPTGPSRVIINGREFAGNPVPGNLSSPRNESWDGFDDENPFLARVAPGGTISTSTVTRVSFFPTLSGTALSAALDNLTSSLPDGIDNDNDGSLDGIFLNWGLPNQTDAYGNRVQLRASVLVVDLDARFNVNAHDSLVRIIHTGTNHPAGANANWTDAFAQASVPAGSGYGAAEVNGGKLFVGAPPNTPFQSDGTFATTENSQLLMLSGGRTANTSRGSRPTDSRFTADENTPRIGTLEGKYGEKTPSDWNVFADATRLSDAGLRFARPGEATVDDAASRMNDTRTLPGSPPALNYGVPPQWWIGSGTNNYNWLQGSATPVPPRGIFNSPPDLHGRMKATTLDPTDFVPRLVFAQPEWSDASEARESKDDPYELLLDTRRGLGGWYCDPATGGEAPGTLRHNPFTFADLQAVIRPYDVDTNRHPSRLAAMIGSAIDEARLKITTDSWDTTAITGGDPTNGAAARLRDWLAAIPAGVTPFYGTSPIDGILNGEIGRNERFDLNRPLAAAAAANAGYQPGTQEYHRQRIAYFKDLYTLLVALEQGGGGALSPAVAAELAQWAANVVEFRDADSRVIPFEYDIDPRNGWNVDNDVRTDEGGDRHVVWGCERPEILIQETLAWENGDSGTPDGGLFIALHRPWNARAYGSGTNNYVDAEPCDVALDKLLDGDSGRPTNVVDLGKKPHQAAGSDTNPLYGSGAENHLPIWRLRLVTDAGTRYIRLDTGPNAMADVFVSNTVTEANTEANGDAKPKLGVDKTLALFGSATIRVGDAAQVLAIADDSHQLAGSGPVMMPGVPAGPAPRPGTCYLERLSDPTPNYALTRTETIPGTGFTGEDVWNADPDNADTATLPIRYIPVDVAEMRIYNTGTTAGGTGADPRSMVRRLTPPTGFWKAEWNPGNAASAGSPFPSPAPAAPGIAWLPWPNRPFVSAAELLLVPRGDARALVEDYVRLTPANQTTRGCPVPLARVLDAVHVPSRFAGIHTTGTGNYEVPAGIFSSGSNAITTVNQFSSFREPGRVNLNTVTSEDIWNAVVAGPLDAAVVTGSAAGLGIVSGTVAPDVARSAHGMLTLSATGALVVSDTNAATTVLAHDRNPLHEIYTATRLANTATTRSNVFAIWITLREAVADDPDSVKFHRAFYIVDRSIPVAFEPERVHNVWDCVRLRRIIE